MKVALYAAGLIIVSMAWALPQHSQLHWWLKSIIVAIRMSNLLLLLLRFCDRAGALGKTARTQLKRRVPWSSFR